MTFLSFSVFFSWYFFSFISILHKSICTYSAASRERGREREHPGGVRFSPPQCVRAYSLFSLCKIPWSLFLSLLPRLQFHHHSKKHETREEMVPSKTSLKCWLGCCLPQSKEGPTHSTRMHDWHPLPIMPHLSRTHPWGQSSTSSVNTQDPFRRWASETAPWPFRICTGRSGYSLNPDLRKPTPYACIPKESPKGFQGLQDMQPLAYMALFC